MNCYICGAGKAEDRCVRCKKNVCNTHKTYVQRRVVCEFCAGEIGNLEQLIQSLERDAVQAKATIASLETARGGIGAGDYERLIKKKLWYCSLPAIGMVVVLVALQFGARMDLRLWHYFLGVVVGAGAVLFWIIFRYVKTVAAYPAQRNALDQDIAKAKKFLAGIETKRQSNEELLRQKVAEIARLTYE